MERPSFRTKIYLETLATWLIQKLHFKFYKAPTNIRIRQISTQRSSSRKPIRSTTNCPTERCRTLYQETSTNSIGDTAPRRRPSHRRQESTLVTARQQAMITTFPQLRPQNSLWPQPQVYHWHAGVLASQYSWRRFLATYTSTKCARFVFLRRTTTI